MSGFISLSLFSKSSVLNIPTLELRATIWRLILDLDTLSKSTSVSSPTPLLAIASAQNPPTPPSPNTAICEEAILF